MSRFKFYLIINILTQISPNIKWYICPIRFYKINSYMKFSLLFLSLIAGIVLGQESPLFVSEPTSFQVMPSISSRTEFAPAISKEKVNDGRSSRNKVIIGKDPQTQNDLLASNAHPLTGKFQSRTPSLVFDGFTEGSNPSDPSLAVGPNHVFLVFNTGFKVFDKEGNALTGDLAPSNIFGTDGCCDLTASYDNAADRWVITLLGSGAFVAVSSTGNPVTSDWYVYSYGQVNDYQKLSVWSDGYYMTDNTSSSNNVYAFEREKMLEGDSSAQIIGFPLTGITTSGFYSPQAFNVCNDNLPAPGNVPIVYMQDDAWPAVAQDHLKLWTINVDWENTSNSTISEPTELVTTPFISVFDGGSFSNLSQPGGGDDIDALQATIMNQAQFRKFGNHNSAVFNFVVDTDAGNGEMAAVRWFELRQTEDGAPWQIYQEGTYNSPDDKHAWCASMNIDLQGNIGMGYTAMGNEIFASAYYTGRRVNDPLNTMTFEETLISQGDQRHPYYRYGDYSKLDLDPANDKQFWFTTEINRGGIKDIVGVFQLVPNFNQDVGVVSIDSPVTGSLSTTEQVSVTVYNYGEDDQTDIPLTLYVDGSMVAEETFSGTLAAGETTSYTFASTADLGTEGTTYTLTASTQLAGDEDPENDAESKEVTHLYANDLGVTAIISPESGSSLGEQTITVEVYNYGAQTQSDFTIYYQVNGNAPVEETYTANIAQGETQQYTFATPYNFNAYGDYTIVAGTDLAMDAMEDNDEATTEITNFACVDNYDEPNLQILDQETVSTTLNIEESAIISDVNVTLNITHTWVSDLTINVTAPDGTVVNLVSSEGDDGDNFVNTTFDDDAETPIAGQDAPFTGTFVPEQSLSAFNGLNMQGEWTISITDDYQQDQGTLLNWTLNMCSDDFLSTEAFTQNNFSFDVAHKGNDMYMVQVVNQEMQGKATMEVYNMEGRLLLSRKLENQGNMFTYDLDMSYATPGVYIIRMTDNNQLNATKRIIVK